MNYKPIHSFHIPVMGLSYTIDSPLKVAPYGISSVVSIVDDELIERMRELYSQKFNFSYASISTKIEDYRAKRITAYLDMVDDIVKTKFRDFKEELSQNKNTLLEFMGMLPGTSALKDGLQKIIDKKDNLVANIKHFVEENFLEGGIDVNIMSKIDKDNFKDGKPLPVMYNDAHAALRGFAHSKLSSSLVLSAGMNPRLYSYLEEFDDFFPDAAGNFRKKIILKVSDFRSAMIQGNFLAKKGLWVSEHRIESGLNCGGHAFPTDGLLMGPILEEFKQKKNELKESAYALLVNALKQKGKNIPPKLPSLKISVQGGVGTAEEHEFLLTNYLVDSVGWGSPFLLVPEATTVDPETRKLLIKSTEDDFYLSDISPLGVPFNTIKNTTNEIIKNSNNEKGRYGSSCPKKLLALSKEYSPEGTCTASTKHQKLKLAELESIKHTLDSERYQEQKSKIIEKSCLCVGLANAAYLDHGIKIKGEKQGVVICPGPNLAFFDKELSLADMVKHIYGIHNVLPDNRRPHVFINELKLYVDYLKREIEEFSSEISKAQVKKWETFKENLLSGVSYYESLFENTQWFKQSVEKINTQLGHFKSRILAITIPQEVSTPQKV